MKYKVLYRKILKGNTVEIYTHKDQIDVNVKTVSSGIGGIICLYDFNKRDSPQNINNACRIIWKP